MKDILNLFSSTLSFLTIFPVKKTYKNFGYKMFLFFPVIGFILGVVCYYLYFVLLKFFNKEISVLFVLFFYILIFDYLHLDGFVDTIDALFGSIKKNYIEILKDPHIGVVGCIYLFMILLAKYFLFFESNKISYILTPMFSKTGLVLCGFFGKKLTDGIGEKFLHRNFFIITFCSLCCFILFFLVLRNLYYSVAFVVICFLCTFILSSFFNKKFGGVNGDVFGFINEILEILFLIIFVGVRL